MRRPYPALYLLSRVHLNAPHAEPTHGLQQGHRETVYHNGMVIRLRTAGLAYESEPFIAVTLADGTVVKGQSLDFVVETSAVELKAHVYTMSRDEQAQVIGYFAALPETGHGVSG